MREFSGKVAVVTGAASGIGRAIAERCVHEGMKVVLADIEQAPLMQTIQDLEEGGGEVVAVVTDVSEAEDVDHLANEARSTFGAVHLLFNNAGVAVGKWIWESPLSEWEWVFGVNLWGVIHGIRAFVPMMLSQDTVCHIVNTASLAGLTTYPGGGIYQATKHAVVAVSEVLHHELRLVDAKVGVSVLCPGGVNTQIGQSARNRTGETPEPAGPTEGGPGTYESAENFWSRIWEEALEPEEIAESVFAAIRDERFYILTHPEYNEAIRTRFDNILRGQSPSSIHDVLVSYS